MKNKKIVSYFTGASLLMICILVSGGWYYHHNLSFTCTSSMASFYSNEGDKPFINFTQNINFNYFGKASVHLSGYLYSQDGRKFKLDRSVFYRYTRILGTHDYRLQVKEDMRSGNDTIPAVLERRHLMPVIKGESEIFGIRRLPNRDMIISNNAGPYLICAVHQQRF
ncbi:hypothetical protein MXL54_12025 [Enterobacteriaceae bacterium G50]|nr:hypothetical protein [Enterobacteriaceae bacterium G50]